MSDEIRISGIVEESIVDGPGLRYVLFTQGCPHHCKGCHNPTTHPFDGGRMVSPDWVFADVRKNPIVRGVTFSGGEPFVQSGKLAPLAERLRAAGYNLTSYTGYLYEELLADSRHMPLLRQLDIRGKYNINVVAIHSGEDFNGAPDPDQILNERDSLIVIGNKEDLIKLR